jgi:hypothetical protein
LELGQHGLVNLGVVAKEPLLQALQQQLIVHAQGFTVRFQTCQVMLVVLVVVVVWAMPNLLILLEGLGEPLAEGLVGT